MYGYEVMEDDCGIVCYPSVTGARETCMAYVNNPLVLMIPSSCMDEGAERLGLVMEGWAADSCDQVIVPYFEFAVIGKGTRDKQSAEMVRILRERRAYDLCYPNPDRLWRAGELRIMCGKG